MESTINLTEVQIDGLHSVLNSIQVLLDDARAQKIEVSNRLGGFAAHDKPEYLTIAVRCDELSAIAVSVSKKMSALMQSRGEDADN